MTVKDVTLGSTAAAGARTPPSGRNQGLVGPTNAGGSSASSPSSAASTDCCTQTSPAAGAAIVVPNCIQFTRPMSPANVPSNDSLTMCVPAARETPLLLIVCQLDPPPVEKRFIVPVTFAP